MLTFPYTNACLFALSSSVSPVKFLLLGNVANITTETSPVLNPISYNPSNV